MMRFPGRSEETSYTTRLVSYKPKPRLEEHRLASCLITGQDSGGRERHKQGIPSSAHSPCFTEGFPLSNKCPTLSTSSKKKKKKKRGVESVKTNSPPFSACPHLKKKRKKSFPKRFFLLPLQLPDFLRKRAWRIAGLEQHYYYLDTTKIHKLMFCLGQRA